MPETQILDKLGGDTKPQPGTASIPEAFKRAFEDRQEGQETEAGKSGVKRAVENIAEENIALEESTGDSYFYYSVDRRTEKGSLRLRKKGKEKLGEAYQQIRAEAVYGRTEQEAAQAIRSQVQEATIQLRTEQKALRATIRKQLVAECKDTKNPINVDHRIKIRSQEFRDILSERVKDSDVFDSIKLQRKLLQSLERTARNEIQKEELSQQIKAVTEDEIKEFKSLRGTDFSDALARRAVAQQKLANVRRGNPQNTALEELPAAEEKQLEILAVREVPVQAPERVKRADDFLFKIRGRTDEVKKRVIGRVEALTQDLKLAGEQTAFVLNGTINAMKSRPLYTASVSLVLAASIGGYLNLASPRPADAQIQTPPPAAGQLEPAGNAISAPSVAQGENQQTEVLATAAEQQSQTQFSNPSKRGMEALDMRQKIKEEKEAREAKERLMPPKFKTVGIRVNSEALMEESRRLGFGKVRIDVEDGKVDKVLANKINAAKDNNLDVLSVFHPQKLLSKGETAIRLKALYSLDKNMVLEIGNEPDNPIVPFWQEGKSDPEKLTTFAQFIKMTAKEAWQINPEAKLVVGALVKQENIDDLVKYVKNAGLSDQEIKKLIWGIHAYQDPDDVPRRAGMVKKATGGAEIWLTEGGVTIQQGDRDIETLRRMIETSSASVSEVYLHQLEEYHGEQGSSASFGYVDPSRPSDTKRANALIGMLRNVEQTQKAAASSNISKT